MDLNLNGGVCQLHKAAALEAGRYSMNQIDMRQVTTDDGPKMRCAATDGRVLAVVDLSYDFGEDMPGRVSTEAWQTAAKLKPNKKGCQGPVMKANGKVVLAGKDGETIEFERPADDPDSFPKYESVIPIVKPGAIRIGVNPLLLMAAAEAIGLCKEEPAIVLTVNDPDEESPRLVELVQRRASTLQEALDQGPPDLDVLERPEGLTDEQWIDRLAQHQLAHDLAVDAWRVQRNERVHTLTLELLKAVGSLRTHPERPAVSTPILVTRPSVTNARAAVMPITLS